MNDEDLRQRLRSAAAGHHPDRARMLARIERGMAGEAPERPARPPRAPMPWLRVAGATVAVCGVLAAGAFAVAQTGAGQREGGQQAAGPASPETPGTGATDPGTPTASGAPAGSGSPAAPKDPASGEPVRGGALPTEAGPLWSKGTVDPNTNRYWAQSTLTLRASQPLAALTVELRIALNGGVNSTGAWRSLPDSDFTATAEEEGGFLVYRWTLKPGRGVPAGTHTFAGQYNHAEGDRVTGRDDYTVRARAAGEQTSVGGDFTTAR
ncbi:hypothetical protein [Streptomyces nitrosporeus]|uniref:hypothetical protein n=1 Tax=Streptomyces nitrosporeus TaxID=28894 RepID=UPI00399FB586